MLRGEWGELELVSALIDELHQRRGAAEKMGNIGRVEELAAEISAAQRQRDRLVERITAHLGTPA